eukprot:tig00000248_g21820.t1
MVARALHGLLASGVQLNGSYAPIGQRATVPFGTQLKNWIINNPIEGLSGRINLDANGDRIAPFALVQFDGNAWRRVGRITIAGAIEPAEPPFVWRGGLKPYDGSCAAGTALELTANGTGTCTPCKAGQYSEVGFRTCRECPAGTYSAKASPGTAAQTNGSASCEPCSPGYFAASAGAVSCIPCPPGTYENRFASVECTRSDVDEYVPAPASLRATKCPANSRTNRIGSYNVSDCICAQGQVTTAKVLPHRPTLSLSIPLKWPNLLITILSFSSALSDPVQAILNVDCVLSSPNVCALTSMFLIQPSVSSMVLDLFRCKTLSGARTAVSRSFGYGVSEQGT